MPLNELEEYQNSHPFFQSKFGIVKLQKFVACDNVRRVMFSPRELKIHCLKPFHLQPNYEGDVLCELARCLGQNTCTLMTMNVVNDRYNKCSAIVKYLVFCKSGKYYVKVSHW